MNRRPALSRCACVRAGLSRVLAAACSLVLAASLIPIAPALAEEEPSVEGASLSIEEMLAAGSYVEGEALVVYRADATQPRARSFAAADPLADAGFAVEDSWDFTQTNAAARTMSLDEGPGDADAGATIARVTKPGVDTAALLEELQTVEGVLAVAPNYVHEAVEPPQTQEALPVSPSSVTQGSPEESNEAGTEESAISIVAGTEVPLVNKPNPSLTNDPLVGLQWALDNTSVSDGGIPADSSVNLASVYEQAAASDVETIVAVIDDGVDYSHEDLRGAMWENPGDIPGVPGRKGTHGYDFIDGDDEPRPEDVSDLHGTQCAGVIASSNNATGVSGISPKTKIMAFRASGVAAGDSLNDAAAIASYEYVLHAKRGGQNVVAVSNSWGGLISPVTEYAINQAGRAGVLSVFAAGNNSVDVNAVGNADLAYQNSDSPYILSATATAPLGSYAAFASHSRTVVDVAAPGASILSTTPVGSQSYLPAVAKLLDDRDNTPGKRSLYYHSFADFDGLLMRFYSDSGAEVDFERVSIEKGAGFDGREALRVNVEDMKVDENLIFAWFIENPFRGMSWEEAQKVRVAALPGISLAEAGENDARRVVIAPRIWSDRGIIVSTFEILSTGDDTSYLAAAQIGDEWLFNQIRDQETLNVGMHITALPYGQENTTLSFTLSDFGIGFPGDDQAYTYVSGTSFSCPYVAGAVGLLASLYPDESALELRGRIVGGTKGLHDAASGDFPANRGNYDVDGRPKQTASNGALDLSVAASEGVHPNVWGAHEGTDSEGEPAVVLEGYKLDRVSRLVIDGDDVAPQLRAASSNGMRLIVSLPNLLDGARHVIEVSDGEATHTSALAFPKADQRLEFERVIDLPDSSLPGQEGFGSGILIAGADRLFCLDTKGRYLYSYDPDGSNGWEKRSAPSDAGFDLMQFRGSCCAAYSNGKLYATAYSNKFGDSAESSGIDIGVVSYDIATDTWDASVRKLMHDDTTSAGAYFIHLGLASCEGRLCLSIGQMLGFWDPLTDGIEQVDFDKADPERSFRALSSGKIAPLVTIGDELRFVRFAPIRIDEITGNVSEYAMTLGTFDGEMLGVIEPGEGAPRFGADESDALEAAARQGVAATGDSVVFTGASVDGLGDVYQVNATTGEWTSLGVKAPGGGGAGVASACFCRGSYYVLAASTGEDGRPTTSLYRLPDEAGLAPNDHTASAEAGEGGRAEVCYDVLAPKAHAAADSLRVTHVALGDTVTWTATPDEGYAFAGWYDQDGALVGKDAVYRQPVTADVTLTARFASAAGPTPPGSEPGSDVPQASTGSDTPLAGTDSDSPSHDGATGGAESLAPTGDPLGTASGAFALLAIASVALCLAARSIRRPGGK